jgi:hypothetical protein
MGTAAAAVSLMAVKRCLGMRLLAQSTNGEAVSCATGLWKTWIHVPMSHATHRSVYATKRGDVGMGSYGCLV